MKVPHALKLCERTLSCRNRAMSMLWYLAVLLTVLTLLGRSLDGGRFRSMTRADRVAEMFRGIVLPGADSSLHITGTRMFGADVVQFRKRADCFSQSGSWIYNPTPRYIVTNYFGDTHSKCESLLEKNPGALDGDKFKANEIAANGSAADWIVPEYLKWEWKSDEVRCPLQPFNQEDFCRLIGPRQNVLIVGDSVNQQLFWMMLNHLVVNRTGLPKTRPSHLLDRTTHGREVCADVLGPGQGFNLSFVRNDRLSLILHQAQDKKTNFYEWPWINMVEEWNISVLLLNRGAHYEQDANIIESLTNLYSVISTRWPTARVFYRSTPPGHINCTEHHEPLKERDSFDTLTKYAPERFHWADFARQNEISRQITERFGYAFIDLDPIMAVRPDGHPSEIDCLHYCMPGPLDVFPQLFYNTIRLLS